MSGFEIDGNKIVIRYGDREVATTDGTLLQFLTNEQVFSGSITFPNVTKTRIYLWYALVARFVGDNFTVIDQAQNIVGAPPQEYSNTTILAPAVSGADIFIGRIQLSRTTSPSHTWLGQPLSTVVPTNVQISLNSASTLLVEMAPGISRALTIDVEGGNLVAKIQQSVGPPSGNFGRQGNWSGSMIPPNSTSDSTRRKSENVSASGSPSLPIWWNESTGWQRQQNASGTIGPGGVLAAITLAERTQWSGPDRDTFVPYSDPTNYTSTYSITVRGRFGRRS